MFFNRYKHRKDRFRINDDTMTTIVIDSLVFCVLVVLIGFTLACFGIDTSSIVDSALRVFGTELGICGLMTIHKRWCDWIDRRDQDRRERRQKKEEAKNGSDRE